MMKKLFALLLAAVMLLGAGATALAAPEVCPVCNHPQSYFELCAENY